MEREGIQAVDLGGKLDPDYAGHVWGWLVSLLISKSNQNLTNGPHLHCIIIFFPNIVSAELGTVSLTKISIHSVSVF